MQEGQCLLMDPLGSGQDVHFDLGSGQCALQQTPVRVGGEAQPQSCCGERPPTL